MTATVESILSSKNYQRFILLEIPEENRNFVKQRLLSSEAFEKSDITYTVAFGRYFFADINEGHIPFLLNHYDGTRGGAVESGVLNADLLIILSSDEVSKFDQFQEELLSPIQDELKILKNFDFDEEQTVNTAFEASKSLLDEEEGFFNGGSYLFFQSLEFTENLKSHTEDFSTQTFLAKQIINDTSIERLFFSATNIDIEDYLDQQFGLRGHSPQENLLASSANFGAYFFLPSEETLKEIQQ